MPPNSLAPQSAHRPLILAVPPLAMLAVYLSGAEVQQVLGKSFEDGLQAIGVAAAVCGALLRFATAGWADPKARVAVGPSSVVRHPLLLGDFLMLLGLSVNTQVWWFIGLCVAGFSLYVHFLLRREARSAPHAHRAPAFVPDFSVWHGPAKAFSWRRAASREFGSIYLVVACTVMFEVGIDLKTGYATPQAWPADWSLYFLAFGVTSALYGMALALPDRQRRVPVVHTGPVTRGLRVDGRAGIVDTLENLISAGQQEAILRATLDAAEIRLGDRLLDVGCGTGKLAVAAARRTGPAGRVYGVDATPAMIDLARARSHAEHSAAVFEAGVAERLKFKTGSLQAVTSSYFFHHLPSDVKRDALREMWRVLARGGRLVITDYGRPRSVLGYIASFPMRFDFHEYVRPQLRGELDTLLAEARIGPVEVTGTFLGYISVLKITKL